MVYLYLPPLSSIAHTSIAHIAALIEKISLLITTCYSTQIVLFILALDILCSILGRQIFLEIVS